MSKEFDYSQRGDGFPMTKASPTLVNLFALLTVGMALSADVRAADPMDTQPYRYISFDVPNGGANMLPSSINASGQVVGSYWFDCGYRCRNLHGFVYERGQVQTIDFPVMGVTPEVADINDRGQMIGRYSFKASLGEFGFIYRDGVFTTLSVPGSRDTQPYAINNRGQVVGFSYSESTRSSSGFIYSNGEFTVLKGPCAFPPEPIDINDRGQVIGECAIGAPNYYAGFIYSAEQFTIIDVPGAEFTRVTSINNKGQVTGYFEAGDHRQHGFIYSDGALTTIDVPGGLDTESNSINDSGQLAGTFHDATRTRGFAYNNGEFTTLTPPDGYSAGAASINNSGQVTGFYVKTVEADSKLHGFIATPVVAVLDDFDREDGKLGPNWNGSDRISDYKIVNKGTRVRGGGPVYWQPNPFGLDQEAFATLGYINPEGPEQGLLLKVQGATGDYRKGGIAVLYNASKQLIRVATWRRASTSWRNYREIPVTLVNGDKLRARVLTTGRVKIYRNHEVVGTIALGSSDRKFFNTKTGRIGLWFKGSPNAIIDDFGGGTNMLQDSTPN